MLKLILADACRVLEVVEDAGSEARLADGLKALITTFAAATLSVAQHGPRKDSVILVGTAPLISGLEDAQLSLASIASSRYVVVACSCSHDATPSDLLCILLCSLILLLRSQSQHRV